MSSSSHARSPVVDTNTEIAGNSSTNGASQEVTKSIDILLNGSGTDNNSERILNSIHLLLGSELYVSMTDGRTVTGKFTCLDRCGNIILSEAVEKRLVGYVGTHADNSSDVAGERHCNQVQYDVIEHGGNKVYTWKTERHLSQAVIPGNKLAKVEITKKNWERVMGEGASFL